MSSLAASFAISFSIVEIWVPLMMWVKIGYTLRFATLTRHWTAAHTQRLAKILDSVTFPLVSCFFEFPSLRLLEEAVKCERIPFQAFLKQST